MKVLFFIIDMKLGGTEKSLLNLLRELPNTYKVDVLLLKKQGILLKELPKHINIIEIEHNEEINNFIQKSPLNSLKQFLLRGNILKFIYGLFNYINYKITGNYGVNYKTINSYMPVLNIEYDIAVAYAGPHDFISYYVVNKVKASRRIQWIHFDVSKVISLTAFGDKYYQYFDKIFCVSENAKLIFDKKFPKCRNKTSVFKNIVSKSILEKSALVGETFTDDYDGLKILTLGRLSEEKGQQLIPSVVHRLKKEKFKFKWYLIGDGNLKDDILSQIEELDLKDNLIVLGSKINPYRFVKDCDIYVQTSFHEGYCLTVHEAKILEKPVVMTNVASANNLIVHGEDGLIVEISEDGLYKGVKSLLEDWKLLKLLEKNLLCQETVSEIERFNI
jgi:glycosyltransferase involved in cell wall biosynthesis